MDPITYVLFVWSILISCSSLLKGWIRQKFGLCEALLFVASQFCISRFWQVGGSKISSKITVIESLMNVCDKVILGGGMVFTFFKADGKNVGSSLVEDDSLDLAKKLTELAKSKGVELILPVDVVCADKFAADANTQVCSASSIPDGKFTCLSHISRDGSTFLTYFQIRNGGPMDVEIGFSVDTYQ
jgi:hypothetical protein